MLKNVLLGLVGLAVLLGLLAYALPSSVEVERSMVIDAPTEVIHGVLEDLETWPTWTAWDKVGDPTVKYAFSKPARGIGASYTWKGEIYGDGRLTITGSDPETGVLFDTEFDDGAYESHGSILLTADDSGTRTMWTYSANLGLNPLSRYLGLMMDGLVGPDLETGLRRLKHKIESLPPANGEPVSEIGVVQEKGPRSSRRAARDFRT